MSFTSDLKNMLGGGLGGGIGNIIGGLIAGSGNYTNPSNAAMPYLNEASPLLTSYLSPYINEGNNAYNAMFPQLSSLIQNPGEFINQLGQGFQASPGYNWNVSQMERAANNAASAGGMLGSPQHQQQVAQMVGGLANQNYYQWLQNAENMFGQGMGGLQTIYGTGANTANNLSSALANILQSQANLAYAGNADKNMYNLGQEGMMGGMLGQGIGDILNGIASL